jgi:cytoskeletal protein CcmA (bactofilin family)
MAANKPQTGGSVSYSLVAADTLINGEIQTRGDIRIEGEVQGNVSALGEVHICTGAKVTGDLRAANVQIAGKLIGNAWSDGDVTLYERARMRGDLRAVSFSVGTDARYNGIIEINPSEEKAKPAKKAPENPAAPEEKTEAGSGPGKPGNLRKTLQRTGKANGQDNGN